MCCQIPMSVVIDCQTNNLVIIRMSARPGCCNLLSDLHVCYPRMSNCWTCYHAYVRLVSRWYHAYMIHTSLTRCLYRMRCTYELRCMYAPPILDLARVHVATLPLLSFVPPPSPLPHRLNHHLVPYAAHLQEAMFQPHLQVIKETWKIGKNGCFSGCWCGPSNHAHPTRTWVARYAIHSHLRLKAPKGL